MYTGTPGQEGEDVIKPNGDDALKATSGRHEVFHVCDVSLEKHV
jgi:hypothetical protein